MTVFGSSLRTIFSIPNPISNQEYDKTEAGKVILEARRKMKEKKVPQSEWFYLAPAARQ